MYIAFMVKLLTAAGLVVLAFGTAVNAGGDIPVVPGDFSGQKYKILGTVDYPGKGKVVLDLFAGKGATCGPDDVRQAALKQYPTASAVIGFTQWTERGQPQCSGTVVQFLDPGPPSTEENDIPKALLRPDH